MKKSIYNKALVACILSALMLTACSQPSEKTSDSGASSESAYIEFDPESAELAMDTKIEINSSSPPVKIEVEYSPLEPNGEMEDSAHIIAFMDNFLRCTAENPAETKCSPEVQEAMKANPTAAQDLNKAMPIYVQTQAQQDAMVYIRYAYDAEDSTISELFTFEIVDGNLTLADPDKLASFVSGGAYEVAN